MSWHGLKTAEWVNEKVLDMGNFDKFGLIIIKIRITKTESCVSHEYAYIYIYIYMRVCVCKCEIWIIQLHYLEYLKSVFEFQRKLHIFYSLRMKSVWYSMTHNTKYVLWFFFFFFCIKYLVQIPYSSPCILAYIAEQKK